MVNDRFFSFASEMKAFLALRCYNYGFDQGNIIKALHNIDGLEGTEGCLLQGVKRLMGGHCLILGSNGIPVIKRWWYTLDHLVQVPDTFEKQVEQFRELFFDACRIRMRSDVSIGTSLSGGLDSSCVLAAIHKIGQVEGFTTDWQKAFVICYPGTNLDERQYARIMIESTRASPVYTVVEYDVFTEHIRDMIYQSEEIFWVLWEGPWLNYKVMRENRVFVSMDGHGADELFGGYAPIVDEEKKFALQHGKLLYYLTLRKTLKNLKEGSALVNLSIIDDALYFLTSNGMSTGRKLLKKRLKDKKQTILNDNPVLERKRSNESHLNNLLYDYFHTYKLPTILRGFDRMSMAHGVEIRMPFMDWRLVTYAFSLPDNGKISHGYTKYILRASMDLIIPESVRLRTNKIGFSSPMAQWFESGLGNLILPVITDLTRQYPQFYPPGNLVEDMEQCIAQKKWDLLTSLWPTIQIYLLIDVFNKKRESLLLL